MTAMVDTPNLDDNKPNESRRMPIPSPYWEIFHPFKSWIDVMISILAPFLIHLSSVASQAARKCPETAAVIHRLRNVVQKIESYPIRSDLIKWAKGAGCDIGECIIRVNRHVSILSQWKIIDKKCPLLSELLTNEPENGAVELILRFPIDIVPISQRTTEKSRTTGCTMVKSIDLTSIPKDIPIVVWFHGGGQILGQDGNDSQQTEWFLKLLQAQQDKTKGDYFPPLIIISVSYRLAPEDPFPAGIVDALSAVEYIVSNTTKDHKIHFAGVSAGALFATVSCLETWRQYPACVQSCLAISPMINPIADSMSYYRNSKSAGCCPVLFLRWCWRASLQLPESKDTIIGDSATLEKVLAQGSNQTTWSECQWSQTKAWARLTYPATDIPKGLSLQFLVAPNKADVLYNDATELVAALQTAGANVTLQESLGNHVLGWLTHPGSRIELIELWRRAIFDLLDEKNQDLSVQVSIHT